MIVSSGRRWTERRLCCCSRSQSRIGGQRCVTRYLMRNAVFRLSRRLARFWRLQPWPMVLPPKPSAVRAPLYRPAPRPLWRRCCARANCPTVMASLHWTRAHDPGRTRMRMISTIYLGLRDVWLDVRVRGLLLFAFSMIALATVTFWLVEGWSLLDAAFFSVVTISTVGYGELVPQTVLGKIFAMFYILIGLGVFVAAASAVAEALLRRRETDKDKSP